MQETVVGIRKPKVKLSPQMQMTSFVMSCRDVRGDCKTPQNERLLVLKERIVSRYRIAKAFRVDRFASIPFDSSHRVAVEPISWLQWPMGWPPKVLSCVREDRADDARGLRCMGEIGEWRSDSLRLLVHMWYQHH